LTGAEQSPREVNPDVPKGIDQVCMRALALDPEERYQSAASFSAALEDAATEAHLSIATARVVGELISGLPPVPPPKLGEKKAVGSGSDGYPQSGSIPRAASADSQPSSPSGVDSAPSVPSSLGSPPGAAAALAQVRSGVHERGPSGAAAAPPAAAGPGSLPSVGAQVPPPVGEPASLPSVGTDTGAELAAFVRPKRRGLPLMIAVGAVAVVLGAAFVWLVSGSGESSETETAGSSVAESAGAGGSSATPVDTSSTEATATATASATATPSRDEPAAQPSASVTATAVATKTAAPRPPPRPPRPPPRPPRPPKSSPTSFRPEEP
jgi:serine/threonine-protein kinase